MNTAAMSEYERRALREIHEWKNPQMTWFDSAMRVASWPIDKASDLVMNAPGIGWVIEKSATGLVGVLNDAAQWSVQPNKIFEEYRCDGHECINECSDVFCLDLEAVDRTIGFLGAKYKGIALVEGAAAGGFGAPGIPPDIVALIGLNLRAIGEYATYCGFDVSTQQERLFAMNILSLASSPTDAAKVLAMAQLVRLSKDVAMKRAWKELGNHTLTQLVKPIAKALGTRLTKAKMAQVINYVGPAIGGGFNAYYTSKVADAAFYLYRERFLAEKYGPEIIEETVDPAEDLDGAYEEEDAEFASL